MMNTLLQQRGGGLRLIVHDTAGDLGAGRCGIGVRRGWACLLILVLLVVGMAGGGYYLYCRANAPAIADRTRVPGYLSYAIAGSYSGETSVESGGSRLPYRVKLTIDKEFRVVAAAWTDMNTRGSKEEVSWKHPTDVRYEGLFKRTSSRGPSRDGRVTLVREGVRLSVDVVGSEGNDVESARFEADAAFRGAKVNPENGYFLPDDSIPALMATVTAELPAYEQSKIPTARGEIRLSASGLQSVVIKIAEKDPRYIAARSAANLGFGKIVRIRLTGADVPPIHLPHAPDTYYSLQHVDLDTSPAAILAGTDSTIKVGCGAAKRWHLRVVFRKDGEKYAELIGRDEQYRVAGSQRLLKRPIRFPLVGDRP